METAPLLTSWNGLSGPNVLRDHPAFLRACHSPWRFIPQNILAIIRGVLLALLTATGVMIVYAKANEKSEFTHWRHFFDFALLSFVLVFVYHVIAFCWTFTHLYYPRREDCEGGVESWIVAAMSLPSNMGSLRKQFYFTLFYTVAAVFCFMNTAIYWFITRQQEREESHDKKPPADDGLSPTFSMPVSKAPFSDLFGAGWFKIAVIIMLYAIPSGLMILEIFLLNSIKRPYAIGAHVVGLIFITGLYLGWAAIGKLLTDWYPFFWLDEARVGSQEAVTAYCLGFVLMAPTLYTLMQGIVAIREGATRTMAVARAEIAAENELEEE